MTSTCATRTTRSPSRWRSVTHSSKVDFEECKRKLNQLGTEMAFVKNEIGINDENKA